MLDVAFCGDNLKVVRVIVPLVKIPVVDLHPVRDRPAQECPYQPVRPYAMNRPVGHLDHNTEVALSANAFGPSWNDGAQYPVENSFITPNPPVRIDPQNPRTHKTKDVIQSFTGHVEPHPQAKQEDTTQLWETQQEVERSASFLAPRSRTFGGKSSVAADVWARLGSPKQYIEPFAGSLAVLLAAPERASLEVIGDFNFYVANFWRCVRYQPEACAVEADYPVSHVDLDARHRWLTDPARTADLRARLADPEWPGDARIAGWWVWGQCAWIGSGWCEREVSDAGVGVQSQIPHVGNAGQGVQSKIPHVGDAGKGVQSQIPHVGDAGKGVQSQIPHVGDAGKGVQSQIPHVSDAGKGLVEWFRYLSGRLARVRIIHGDWTRTLNHHHGGKDTAIFFDPPYVAFERLYASGSNRQVALAVADWCREHADEARIALCGHRGDYDLPGWDVLEWSRNWRTYGGTGTKDEEAIWFSPTCIKPKTWEQGVLL
jgi:hypothetical protein